MKKPKVLPPKKPARESMSMLAGGFSDWPEHTDICSPFDPEVSKRRTKTAKKKKRRRRKK
jgi:hypothetical protein